MVEIKLYKILKIKLFRFYLRYRVKDEVDEYQEYAVKIVKKVALSHDAEITYAPISVAYYIEKDDFIIKIVGYRVIIIHGNDSKDLYLTKKQIMEVESFLDHRIEYKRRGLENKIQKQTTLSLVAMLKELQEEDTYNQNF